MANPPTTRRGRSSAAKTQAQAGDALAAAPRSSSPFDSPLASGAEDGPIGRRAPAASSKLAISPENSNKEAEGDEDQKSPASADEKSPDGKVKDADSAAKQAGVSSSVGKNAHRDARRRDGEYEEKEEENSKSSELSSPASEEEEDGDEEHDLRRSQRSRRSSRRSNDWVESDSDGARRQRRSSRNSNNSSRRSSASMKSPPSAEKRRKSSSSRASPTKPVLRPRSGQTSKQATSTRNSAVTSPAVIYDDPEHPDRSEVHIDERPAHVPRVTRQRRQKDTSEAGSEKEPEKASEKSEQKEAAEPPASPATAAAKSSSQTKTSTETPQAAKEDLSSAPSEELHSEDDEPEDDYAQTQKASSRPLSDDDDEEDSDLISSDEDRVLSGPETPSKRNSLLGRLQNYRRRSDRKKSDVNRLRYSPPASRSDNRRYRRDAKGRRRRDSGSDDSSSSETAWRRKNKAKEDMARNAIVPVNLNAEDIAALANNHLKDGTASSSKSAAKFSPSMSGGPRKPGQALEKADIQPMQIDRSISWDSIGGLSTHIKALKEMVLFPLLYPEVFARFNMTPPRGVLFYGPPGTGKTLMARALANTCSQAGNRVAFFMRKGADCLSKWVGEAERQLRLLFEEAAKMQPSIIFFDEIDGLAPVRSSRQDQIHNSIVSTLLALMDGLDSRGQIVVIGATNRIDTIDPALRRPGRFDREFPFMLPTQQARREILKIHTKSWDPPVDPKVRDEVADLCVGYCGADIKSLATEAALRALRRRYPQIYESGDKLLIDPGQIVLTRADFFQAMRDITPAQARVSISNAAPLPAFLRPLLTRPLDLIISTMQQMFPPLRHKRRQRDLAAAATPSTEVTEKASDDDDEEDEDTVFQIGEITVQSFKFGSHAPLINRPRLLICGEDGNQGQPHVAAAVLHRFEEVPVFCLDFASLNADISAKSMEEAAVHIISEARRKLPAVLFLPHLDSWYHAAHESLRLCLHNLLNDIPPSLPLFLLATADTTFDNLPSEASALFPDLAMHQLGLPDASARREFFAHVATDVCTPPEKPERKSSYRNEVLPKAPPPATPVALTLTADELKRKQESEERHWLRELRMTMRDFIHRLLSERKYRVFEKPVDPDEVSDYYDLIQKPMCLELMLQKVDAHRYKTIGSFVKDIELMVENARKYNDPVNDPMRVISKANHLLDNVEHMLYDMNHEEIDQCDAIAARHRAAGDDKWDLSDAEAPYQKHLVPKPKPPKGPALFDLPDQLELEREDMRRMKRKPSTSKLKEAEKIERTKCEVCGSAGHASRMLLCDGCDDGYHTYCLTPPLRHIPSGNWFCAECIGQSLKRKERLSKQPNRLAESSPQKNDDGAKEKETNEKSEKPDHASEKLETEINASSKEHEKGKETREPNNISDQPLRKRTRSAEAATKHSDSAAPPKAAPPSPPRISSAPKRRKMTQEPATAKDTDESSMVSSTAISKRPAEAEKAKETESGVDQPMQSPPERRTKRAKDSNSAPAEELHNRLNHKEKEKPEKNKPSENKEKDEKAKAREKEKGADTEPIAAPSKPQQLQQPTVASSSSSNDQEKEKLEKEKAKEKERSTANEQESNAAKQSDKSVPSSAALMEVDDRSAANEKSQNGSLSHPVIEIPLPPSRREPSPPPPPFIFDVNAAKAFVTQLVSVTEGFNVEELCAVHAKVQRVIFDHRSDYNRDAMIRALAQLVQSLKK